MTSSAAGLKLFVKNLPRELVFATVLLPLAGFSLGYYTGFTVAVENTRLFLSTLAGAQAGILAIVFSVTVIGIQLVATRYSPRMISLFTDSPTFIYVFALFVASISVDLALLYTVPEMASPLYTGFVVGASGLGLATAYGLLVFVKSAIRESTPGGAIDAFVSRMSTAKYRKEVEKSLNSESEFPHPMRPLYSLTINAISKGEKITAKKALQEYGNLVKHTLQDLEQEDVLTDENRKLARELFTPVLTEHLHDIALHAEEHDEIEIVSSATALQRAIGKNALNLPTDVVSDQAQRGLANVIRDSGIDEGQYFANSNAWKQLGKLLVDASDHPKPTVVWSICSSISTNVNRQLWKFDDVYWYQDSMTDLYREMSKAHESLLEDYGDELAELDIDWKHEQISDSDDQSEGMRAVSKFRKTLFETTTQYMKYLVEEGDYPIIEGNLKSSWKRICTQAADSPANEYAVTLCQALIEIAFVEGCEQPDSGLPWAQSIRQIREDGHSDIVDEAFDRILSYDYVEEEPTPFGVLPFREHREKYYSNQITVNKYQPLNTRIKFDEIVREIEERSQPESGSSPE